MRENKKLLNQSVWRWDEQRNKCGWGAFFQKSVMQSEQCYLWQCENCMAKGIIAKRQSKRKRYNQLVGQF